MPSGGGGMMPRSPSTMGPGASPVPLPFEDIIAAYLAQQAHGGPFSGLGDLAGLQSLAGLGGLGGGSVAADILPVSGIADGSFPATGYTAGIPSRLGRLGGGV